MLRHHGDVLTVFLNPETSRRQPQQIRVTRLGFHVDPGLGTESQDLSGKSHHRTVRAGTPDPLLSGQGAEGCLGFNGFRLRLSQTP